MKFDPETEAELRRIIREEMDEDRALRDAASPHNLEQHREHYRNLRPVLEGRRNGVF